MIFQDNYRFRLYVAGHTPISSQAVADLKKLCRTHLHNRYHIEIVDVVRYPQRALKDGILMTPALVRLEPTPIKKIVTSLHNAETMLQELELEKLTA